VLQRSFFFLPESESLFRADINIATCVTAIPPIKAKGFIVKYLKAYQSAIPKSGNLSIKSFIARTAIRGLEDFFFFSLTIVVTVQQAIRKYIMPTTEPTINPFVTAWFPSIKEMSISRPEIAADKKKFFLGYPRSEAFFLVIIVITFSPCFSFYY
jgi:hypothetical protein